MELELIQQRLMPVLGLPPLSNEQWDVIKHQCDIAETKGLRLASKFERDYLDPPDLCFPKTMPFLLFVKANA